MEMTGLLLAGGGVWHLRVVRRCRQGGEYDERGDEQLEMESHAQPHGLVPAAREGRAAVGHGML